MIIDDTTIAAIKAKLKENTVKMRALKNEIADLNTQLAVVEGMLQNDE